MPSRKSDQRKSDVTAARFALAEPLPEDNPPAETAAEVQPPSTALPAVHPEKNDKEKEKEKEKEKDLKDRDSKDAELNLPKSIITRLAKGMLPPNTQIQANAILALSKSATIFISYLASHANENTVSAGKKTISPADVFKALDEVEFSFMRERLEAEFNKFNSIQTEKRTSYRRKVRAAKQNPDGTAITADGDDTDMADTTAADTTMASEQDGPRASKKARIDASAKANEGDTEDEEPDAAEGEDEAADDDEDDDEDVGEEDEDAQEDEASGDETQDALEEKDRKDDGDEALDGDESD
ncbi:hypothetical protein S7711_07977 [Stachybotrys chartarum IBT 7711]|uniref:DNA polymerase epsilon subunit D n=1 Tax=Stachybotrys chartarum (strain CBS 109288 / IBT 7711) TaxID=1280523 RepID=A0A084ANC7_STACB|nr:hypothetical protein S7711_07977 [Stachybotrys chartarum IBT 7711]KFA48465.1 hypothetical protein S40293_00356 [Stachybotrys chartarum IBT 40293]